MAPRECIYCHAGAPVALERTSAWRCLDGIDCYGRQEAAREAVGPGTTVGVLPDESVAVSLTGAEIRLLCLTLRLVVRIDTGYGALSPESLAGIVAMHDKLRPLECCEIVPDEQEADEEMDDILAMLGIGQ